MKNFSKDGLMQITVILIDLPRMNRSSGELIVELIFKEDRLWQFCFHPENYTQNTLEVQVSIIFTHAFHCFSTIYLKLLEKQQALILSVFGLFATFFLSSNCYIIYTWQKK